jgi:UDP-hydrolysing UDP-N-acetyl-D-glucosamine 2-epimerase
MTELKSRGHEVYVILGASGYKLAMPYENIVLPNLVENNDCMSMAVTTGLLTTQVAPVLNKIKPDVVIIHGDRHECLGAATAAAYMNIPIAHTEGGESTGTIDDKVRDAITSLADILFPVTVKSYARLHSWVRKKKIFLVGSTALDGLQYVQEMEDYTVILHHPNTTDPEDITPLIEAVEMIPGRKVWVNPNVDAGSKAMLKRIHQVENVEFVKDLPPEEYINLISKCQVLIGNTSSGIKEGAYLGVPTVLVGNRQNGREVAENVAKVPMDKDGIFSAYHYQLEHGRYPQSFRFGDGHAAKKIIDVLEGMF